MVLDALVTILGGENGYGKSTFLEALAIAVGSVVVGGEDLAHARALDRVRGLADALKAPFFIATHSPLLMAYDTLEPVILTRNFPNNCGMFLRRLFNDDS